MSTICFYGQMTNAGQGATGLTVTCDIVRITRSDGTQTSVQNGASATEITTPNARGCYFYRLTGADLTLYDYLATFITAGTADLKHVPALWVRFSEGDAQTGDSYPLVSSTGVVVASGSKTGYSLAASGLDAVLVESSITAGASLTDDSSTQLTSINARQAIALAISALSGVLAGAAGTTVTTKPAGKPSGNTRISATVDSDGNRSALTIKVPT